MLGDRRPSILYTYSSWSICPFYYTCVPFIRFYFCAGWFRPVCFRLSFYDKDFDFSKPLLSCACLDRMRGWKRSFQDLLVFSFPLHPSKRKRSTRANTSTTNTTNTTTEMIYDVNSPYFRSFLKNAGGAKNQFAKGPTDKGPRASENKPVMND